MFSEEYKQFLEKIQLPAVTSIGSNSTIFAANSLNMGVFGPVGRRSANITLTESDSIIVLGSGLDIDITGFDRLSFFENKEILVINPDINLNIEQAENINYLNQDLRNIDFSKLLNIKHSQSEWVKFNKELNKFLTIEYEFQIENLFDNYVDPYKFAFVLDGLLHENSAIVTGISLDVVSVSHSMKLNASSKIFASKHCGQLGWDLPATIGIANSTSYDEIICITGLLMEMEQFII